MDSVAAYGRAFFSKFVTLKNFKYLLIVTVLTYFFMVNLQTTNIQAPTDDLFNDTFIELDQDEEYSYWI